MNISHISGQIFDLNLNKLCTCHVTPATKLEEFISGG
jgi:hypothetical protein